MDPFYRYVSFFSLFFSDDDDGLSTKRSFLHPNNKKTTTNDNDNNKQAKRNLCGIFVLSINLSAHYFRRQNDRTLLLQLNGNKSCFTFFSLPCSRLSQSQTSSTHKIKRNKDCLQSHRVTTIDYYYLFVW
jgi:hypothetical protein